MNKKLFFVRHGSPKRLPGQFLGQMESPLTDEGKEEALKTGKWFKKLGFTGKVYSSPLSRAFDTAQIIVNEINRDSIVSNNNIEIVQELAECDFGLFDGLTKIEFQRKYPEQYKIWLSDPFNNSFPDGESFCDCGKRFAKAVDNILEINRNNNEDILIAAHMCAIQSYFIVIGKKSFGYDFVKKPIACASITSAICDENNDLIIDKWGWIPE